MTQEKFPEHPHPFLTVRISDQEAEPWLIAICAGYESGKWREEQLVEHVMEWLPEFALKYSEWKSLGSSNAVKLLRKAAKAIYNTKNYELRGEFGELFLHMILRQVFKTLPAICKIHYKDSRNDTVKGFDCVHVIPTPTNLELWIGEVKFYKEINAAIRDVIKELHPHTERLKLLLNENISLDEIFDSVSIPVLLTYDSKVISNHSKVTDEFKHNFEEEVRSNWSKFKDKKLPETINIGLTH